LIGTLGALLVGALVGGLAGYAGGAIDHALSRFTDFVLVLPAIYVALALRAAMPLVLSPATVFVLLASIFALLGWPIVARGVRAIVASEREREYVTAGRALGATPWRLLTRHLLPATGGYLAAQATLLLPAFIMAEATLSYVGLGFPDTVPTWGTMLQEAANISLVVDAPWMLAPAAAIFLVVLGVNLVVQGAGRTPVQLEP
jgi:peptide/nickel transport system permease protein